MKSREERWSDKKRKRDRQGGNRCGWVFPRQKCEDSHSELSRMSHNSRSDARPHQHTHTHRGRDTGKSTVAKVTSD